MQNKTFFHRELRGGGLFLFLVVITAGLTLLFHDQGMLSRASSGQLQEIGQYGGASYVVEIEQGRVYAGVGPRLAVFEINEQGQPQKLGESEVMAGVVQALQVQGNLVYVAAAKGGLYIVDVKNAAHPRIVSHVDTDGYSEDVAVFGAVVIVADSPVWNDQGWVDDGLRFFDVTNPDQPAVLADFDTPGHEHGVAIAGGRVYVAGGDGGLYILDISNPAAPQLLGAYDTLGYAMDVEIEDGVAYVADFNRGIRVVDVSDPENPQEMAFEETPGKARSLALHDGWVFTADGETGLRFFDAADLPAPPISGVFEVDGDVRAVAAEGDYLLLADRANGLRVLEWNDVTLEPVQVGFYDTLGYVEGIALDDNVKGRLRAYIASGGNVRVLDLGDVQVPELVGFYRTPGRANDVAIKEKTGKPTAETEFYVADAPVWKDRQWQGGGLRMFSAAHPTAIEPRGFIDTPGQARGLAAANGHVYLADGNGGVSIFNMAQPGNAQKVGQYRQGEPARDIALGNGKAFIATGGRGLAKARVDNAASLRAEASFEATANARGLTFANGNLFVVDMLDPGDPILTGNRWPAPGLHLLDARNPNRLQTLASQATPGDIRNVAVSDELVLVADGDGGIVVLRVGK